MAGEPALDKVLTALKTTLEAALPTLQVDIDRADDDPYGNAEIANGAINIIERRTTFSALTHAETLHTSDIDLDNVLAVEASATNAARLRQMEADEVAALWADRTLGGLVTDIQFASSGGDEDVLTDEGARPLSIRILFLTPIGDHFTVIGADGLHH